MSFYLSFISHLLWRVESVSLYSKSKDQNIFNPFAYLYFILWKLVLLMKLKHSNIHFDLKAFVKKSIQNKYFHAVCPNWKLPHKTNVEYDNNTLKIFNVFMKIYPKVWNWITFLQNCYLLFSICQSLRFCNITAKARKVTQAFIMQNYLWVAQRVVWTLNNQVFAVNVIKEIDWLSSQESKSWNLCCWWFLPASGLSKG